MTRSGFVALAGRPNAGKSTLVNAIVADKVAIVSDKPQTTRARGARHRDGRATGSSCWWTCPASSAPATPSPSGCSARWSARWPTRMPRSSCWTATEEVGAGDRFIAAAIARAGVAPVTVVNKVDRLGRAGTVKALSAAGDLGLPGEVFPLSARTGQGVPELLEHVVALLPEGPFHYPPDEHTDQPEAVRLAELVREQVLRRTRQELPHAVEVEVSEIERRGDGLLMVRAQVWAESESQKGILVGSGGRMIKAIGTAARREIERAGGERMHLELQVRVRRGWRGDEGLLDRLGIE